ncbi:MAG: DUF6691 family protein [Myxococcota bacterium]
MVVIVAFATGLLFAIGLGISGMTQPDKVIGFLDVSGDWDGSLMFVMAGAVAVYALVYWRVRGAAPLLAPRYLIPSRRDLTPRLIIGAALFGVGWGLAGLCPGPAITSLGNGAAEAGLFVLAMVIGMAGVVAVERMTTFVRR